MRLTFLIFSLSLTIFAHGQNAVLKGIVTDENNKPITSANVNIPYSPTGTTTNPQGEFALQIPANKAVSINISFIGYEAFDTTLMLKQNQTFVLNKQLSVDINEIKEVYVTSIKRGTNLTRIEIKDFNVLPNVTGNIETLLKTMPGVSSNNELSSQYSVRGGNYDENLVYVNDVEIYRPFLVRSGQQEGLSFVNPDLVQSIDFSAGGFEARYGDKMSSVLDIQYREPKQWGGSLSASLVGGSAHLEGISKNKKFTHISGLRYKTTGYLLSSLDVEGEYKPNFLDFQSYLTYKISDKLKFGLLGNVSANKYFLTPTVGTVDFGTFTQALRLVVDYAGKEEDVFNTYTTAFITTYQPNLNNTIKLIFSSFNTHERETFDIRGAYSINDIDTQVGSETKGDSIASLGNAGFLKHARNYFDAQVYSIKLKGIHILNNNTVRWGIKAQNEIIDDQINEWEVLDSVDYFVPYRGNQVSTFNRLASNNQLNTYRFNAYLQNTRPFEGKRGEWYFTYGARSSFWTYNKQILFSPRLLINYIPLWNTNINFFASSGYYFQPPFYKEFRDKEGVLNPYILAQKSVHFNIGGDYVFTAWNRPFTFTTEIYYKFLDNLVPYQIDNVRIQYDGNNISKGYAAGLDFKIVGEFVKDAQSWASLSFLKTKEDIEGDYYYEDHEKKYVGYIPRLTNQLVNFSTFFQDYFPNNPDYKFHLTFFFGSKLPITNPYKRNYYETYPIPAYMRVDLGLSKSIKKFTNNKFFKSIWLNAEALNLFGIENVSSYTWFKTIRTLNTVSGEYAVPNNLTGRRLNIKLSIKM